MVVPRRLLSLALAALCCLALATVSTGAERATAGNLCAPMLPARAPLPVGIGLPALTTTTLPMSAHALTYHASCRIGVYSPSDGARYNVNWYVFPSHALAAADLKTLAPSSVFASITSIGAAPGFPKPNYLVRGSYDYFGRVESIITVSFVDGPALVSGSMLGGGTSAQASALARWAEQDIARIEARR